MKLEQYKILATIRVRDNLTAREIAEETGVNLNTVNTWLKRHAGTLVDRAGKRPVSGSKAPTIWVLRNDARVEADRLLDAGRDRHLQNLIDPEEARAAYRDSYRRSMVAHCVEYAAEAEDPKIREQYIVEARSWLEREEKRIAHFKKSGEPLPGAIRDELFDLGERIAAFGLGIDRLRGESDLRSLKSARSWVARTVDRWVKAAPYDDAAFFPLTPGSGSERVDAAFMLRAVLRMSWHVARVGKDLMLVAALSALSHPLDPESRKIITRVLRTEIGDEELGAALHEQLSPRLRPQRSLATEFIAVFVALDRSERFLNQPCVKAWFESVNCSPCWQDRFAPFYAKTALNQRDKQAERLLESLSHSLRVARAEYLQNDDGFAEFLKALTVIRPDDFYKRVPFMLERAQAQCPSDFRGMKTVGGMAPNSQVEFKLQDMPGMAGKSAFFNYLTAVPAI